MPDSPVPGGHERLKYRVARGECARRCSSTPTRQAPGGKPTPVDERSRPGSEPQAAQRLLVVGPGGFGASVSIASTPQASAATPPTSRLSGVLLGIRSGAGNPKYRGKPRDLPDSRLANTAGCRTQSTVVSTVVGTIPPLHLGAGGACRCRGDIDAVKGRRKHSGNSVTRTLRELAPSKSGG